MTEKTPHKWRIAPYGYDPADYCSLCNASNYDTTTKFCEDYYEEKQVDLEKSQHRHVQTEAAWNKIRAALTKEEWELLGFNSLQREYRIIDRI